MSERRLCGPHGAPMGAPWGLWGPHGAPWGQMCGKSIEFSRIPALGPRVKNLCLQDCWLAVTLDPARRLLPRPA